MLDEAPPILVLMDSVTARRYAAAISATGALALWVAGFTWASHLDCSDDGTGFVAFLIPTGLLVVTALRLVQVRWRWAIPVGVIVPASCWFIAAVGAFAECTTS
jgi:hypothetical protein